jgi:hypothetical protein
MWYESSNMDTKPQMNFVVPSSGDLDALGPRPAFDFARTTTRRAMLCKGSAEPACRSTTFAPHQHEHQRRCKPSHEDWLVPLES